MAVSLRCWTVRSGWFNIGRQVVMRTQAGLVNMLAAAPRGRYRPQIISSV
jgi:hypothetical protein